MLHARIPGFSRVIFAHVQFGTWHGAVAVLPKKADSFQDLPFLLDGEYCDGEAQLRLTGMSSSSLVSFDSLISRCVLVSAGLRRCACLGTKATVGGSSTG